jgi:hypothetical protein
MDHTIVPTFVLGERKRFSGLLPDPLAKGVVPAFHVCSLAGLLANAPLQPFGKDAAGGFADVAERAAGTVCERYPLSECPTGLIAPVTVDVTDYLPRPAAFMTFRVQRRPRPCCPASSLSHTFHPVQGCRLSGQGEFALKSFYRAFSMLASFLDIEAIS